MGEDASGNLYIIDFGGKIFRLDLKSGRGSNPADDAADILNGGGGNDRMYGGGGNDRMYGGAGRDSLSGGTGNDNLRGGAGADLLSGGSGFDYADYRGSPGRVIVDLSKTTQAGGDASSDRLSSIEGVIGSAFNDVLKGSTSHNTLRGQAGNDSLSGGAGDDRLYGDAGRDTILGSAGKDSLFGGQGAMCSDGNPQVQSVLPSMGRTWCETSAIVLTTVWISQGLMPMAFSTAIRPSLSSVDVNSRGQVRSGTRLSGGGSRPDQHGR
jgi:Ca2+-binding RTX toxin-like protein